jgi:hypothetical protein
MKTEVKPRLGLAVRVKIKDEIKKGLRIFHWPQFQLGVSCRIFHVESALGLEYCNETLLASFDIIY